MRPGPAALKKEATEHYNCRMRLIPPLVFALFTSACVSTPTVVKPTLDDKLGRLLKLEDERSLGDGEVYGRLSDPAGQLRGRAALVLGRIGDNSAAFRLSQLLEDEIPYVRSMAAFSIGLLEGPIGHEVRNRLVGALDDENEIVRARVIEALGRKGGKDSAEIIATSLAKSIPSGSEPYNWTEALDVSSLRPPHFDVRLGLFALAKLGSLRWTWNLIATQGGTPRFVWWPAAWASAELQEDELQSVFLYYAGSPDPTLRLYGARGLASLGPDRVKDYVRLLVYDPNEKVRIEAIRAAAKLNLDELVPDLLKRLSEDSAYVRAEVLKALGTLKDRVAVDPLIDELGSESGWFRRLALAALANQDPDTFWFLLSGLGTDRDWRLRKTLAELLGRTTGERPRTLLRSMLNDSDARVRASALLAMSRVAPPEIASRFAVQYLRDDDPYTRVAAAESLAHLKIAEAAAPIEQAFLVAQDNEPRIRPSLLNALANLDLTAAVPIAERALDDTEWLVRRQARAVLARADVPVDPVRAQPSEHSVQNFVAHARPTYTPQAFLRTSKGSVELELFVADAPLTVANFITLARDGFYEGLTFHNVVPNGFVRGGDPRGDGNGGPGYAIRSEINKRPFLRGTVAMADHETDTAGSQFFITHLPAPELDGHFTVFGHVMRGMEVIDRIQPGDVIEEVLIWDGVESPHIGP